MSEKLVPESPLPVQSLPVTSSAEHEAWYRHTFPPVEQPRENIWSVPIPFPDNPMRYTLSHLLTGDGETIVVDPGWDSPEGFEAFQAGLATAGVAPESVSGILVTHVHPDHHGLTHYLVDMMPQAWVGMSEAEAKSLAGNKALTTHSGQSVRAQLTAAGVPAGSVVEEILIARSNRSFVTMPDPTRIITDGELVPLRGRQVRAILTPGHTPGHLCFLDADNDAILTGDHVLPRISPNIGLHPHSATSPLRAFLSSLARLEDVDHEVFPAHQWRFRDLPERVAELQMHHRERLDEIIAALQEGPLSAWELATVLSWAHGWDEMHPFQHWSAVAETTAHLVYLIEDAVVVRSGQTPVLYRLT